MTRWGGAWRRRGRRGAGGGGGGVLSGEECTCNLIYRVGRARMLWHFVKGVYSNGCAVCRVALLIGALRGLRQWGVGKYARATLSATLCWQYKSRACTVQLALALVFSPPQRQLIALLWSCGADERCSLYALVTVNILLYSRSAAALLHHLRPRFSQGSPLFLARKRPTSLHAGRLRPCHARLLPSPTAISVKVHAHTYAHCATIRPSPVFVGVSHFAHVLRRP